MSPQDEYILFLRVACLPEAPEDVRRELVMRLYDVAKAHILALGFVVDHVSSNDPIHAFANEQLDTLHKLLSERLETETPEAKL